MAKTLIYHLYPLSWGSIPAMTDFIPHIKSVGADYVWLSPLYPSPGFDHGYDISDYEAIDPYYGSMADFDEFVYTAHSNGIGVMMDLVINHTSVQHPWFREKPEYYYWSSEDRDDWRNLFDDGPAWAYDEARNQYYLHLFHEGQADLAWFDDKWGLNEDLVDEFRRIVHFWISHGVDGFRIDAPQAVNKYAYETFEINDIFYGSRAARVINAIFAETEIPLCLIAEIFDPTGGKLSKAYMTDTVVDYVVDVLLKERAASGPIDMSLRREQSSSALELESHDSPRFTSASGLDPGDIIWHMFRTEYECIILYQGQELGLKNPTPDELPDEELLRLDAQTAMRHTRGQNLADLRPKSRANARIPLLVDECTRQAEFPDSYLNLTKKWVKRWKER